MNDDQLMYVLEAVAYLSASIAAFVYIWETCSPRRRRIRKHKDSTTSINNIERNSNISRRSSSSMYDDF